jgi:8-oxo-dGTP pyrophosphatase MutT (NUDIX family)
MTEPTREFGVLVPIVAYVLRLGGYAVILDGDGLVATVATPGGIWLPGGGQNVGETAAEAAVREAAEECGLRIALGACLGTVDQLAYADSERTYFRKRCTFFVARPIGTTTAVESDHTLTWRLPEEAVALLSHESQRWAVAEACRIQTERGNTN